MGEASLQAKNVAFARQGDGKARERDGKRERVKDDEEVILYLLWHDHRPLRIVNVDDCEYHRLWDIGGWEARASEEIPR